VTYLIPFSEEEVAWEVAVEVEPEHAMDPLLVCHCFFFKQHKM